MLRKSSLLAILLILCLSLPILANSAGVTKLEGDFKVGPAILLIIILVTFVLIGVFNRAKDTSTYWAAGRKISPVGAGMAIASNWMSAASFLGMAAIMYASGYHGPVLRCRLDRRVCTITYSYGRPNQTLWEIYCGRLYWRPLLFQRFAWIWCVTCYFHLFLLLCRPVCRYWYYV